MRVLLFSGDGGVTCALGPDGVTPAAYFAGMKEHPSLEHVRLQPDEIDVCSLTEFQELLVACPALRVIDFSEFWEEGFEPEIRLMRRMVVQNKYGAGRLTHVFFRLRSFLEGMDEEAVVNVLDDNLFGADGWSFDLGM